MGVAFLAFDDTDSRQGGCTTHMALRIAEALDGLDLVGAPRLVRLNPNIPFRTRGNAALCLRIGHGEGAPVRVGTRRDGDPLWAYARGRAPSPAALRAAFETARHVIDRHRERAPGTRPGLVAGLEAPEEAFYWRAVRSWVPQDAIAPLLGRVTHHAAWDGGRGLVGALAAAAWRGTHDATWEVVAYRHADRVGTRRDIDPVTLTRVDALHPGCFDTWDAQHATARAVPATPCPVLFGVRGEDAQATLDAAKAPGPESAAGTVLFATNQATDDHVGREDQAPWVPYSAARVAARVDRVPAVRRGGHVFVALKAWDGRRVMAAAFEPTKGFRRPVGALRPGDAVVATGSFHGDTTTLALEKVEVLEAPPRVRRVKPVCPACGTRMRSRGRGAGFRCRHRHARADAASAAMATVDRPEVHGRHEVPVAVRRHLAKPWARPLLRTR